MCEASDSVAFLGIWDRVWVIVEAPTIGQGTVMFQLPGFSTGGGRWPHAVPEQPWAEAVEKALTTALKLCRKNAWGDRSLYVFIYYTVLPEITIFHNIIFL